MHCPGSVGSIALVNSTTMFRTGDARGTSGFPSRKPKRFEVPGWRPVSGCLRVRMSRNARSQTRQGGREHATGTLTRLQHVIRKLCTGEAFEARIEVCTLSFEQRRVLESSTHTGFIRLVNLFSLLRESSFSPRPAKQLSSYPGFSPFNMYQLNFTICRIERNILE